MTDFATTTNASFVGLEEDLNYVRNALFRALKVPLGYLMPADLNEERARLLGLLSNRPIPFEFVGAGEAYENVCMHGNNAVNCKVCCIGDIALDSWIEF